MTNEYTPFDGQPQAARPNSSLAIISLVSGILGLTLVPLLGSLIAVITGPMARREIVESRGALDGEGLVMAGIILGWIGIGLGVLAICGVGLVLIVPACLLFFGLTTQGSSFLVPALLALL